MVKEISFEETRELENAVFIDVRSEGEYAESHIPGAFNVPIFNNDERAEVGTVYKQTGREQATKLGLEIASGKLSGLVQEIRNHVSGRQPLVVYCWRGGMRSKSVATILDLMGLETYRLHRGYRGYREFITSTLANYHLESRCILIHGMTGTGKSDLLDLLAADGEPVIDLERMAGHKGSAFGGIGENPNNQRTFDSLLMDQLNKIAGSKYFFMEAESQRIGRVRIPEVIWSKKFEAVHVLLEASIPTRVKRLVSQYVIEDDDVVAKLKGAYEIIESRLPTEQRKAGWAALEEHRFEDLAEMLLIHYYDPRYAHAREQYPGTVTVLSSENLVQCKGKIKQIAREALMEPQTTDPQNPDPQTTDPQTLESQESQMQKG